MFKKKIIVLLVAVLLLMGSVSIANIKDIPDNNWAYPYASHMVENNIMELDSEGNFNGDFLVNRGEFVYYIWKSLGSPMAVTTDTPTFNDVAFSDEYCEAIEWAVGHGVTSGTSKTTFSPERGLTREQAFTFLWRALPHFGFDTSEEHGGLISDFKDYGDIDKWARVPMGDLYYFGIVSGTDERYLMPLRDVTRSAAAAIIYRTTNMNSGGEGEIVAEENNNEEQAKLYLIINGEEHKYDFDCEGEITPEKLMDGLTDLTNMKFAYSNIDLEENKIMVHWGSNASYYPDSEVVYLNPKLGFEDFYDTDSTAQFMLDSVWKTMSENMNISNVYFSNRGNDGLDFSGFTNWSISGDESYSGNFYDYYSN